MEKAFASRPRVFVVDDEIDIAKLLVVILQMNLFDALPFADPQAALQAAGAEAPDYLISDKILSEERSRHFLRSPQYEAKLLSKHVFHEDTTI